MAMLVYSRVYQKGLAILIGHMMINIDTSSHFFGGDHAQRVWFLFHVRAILQKFDQIVLWPDYLPYFIFAWSYYSYIVHQTRIRRSWLTCSPSMLPGPGSRSPFSNSADRFAGTKKRGSAPTPDVFQFILRVKAMVNSMCQVDNSNCSTSSFVDLWLWQSTTEMVQNYCKAI